MKKKSIVVIGGGTGTHTVLKGLRDYADDFDIKAIVSMADSGGSTGRLRDEFGYLPIGDVRNALAALANNDSVLLRELFLYRFNKGNGLSGHNFGNLFITALTDILGSEVEAIKASARILNVVGEVIPVTTTNTRLRAVYDDQTIVNGENEIEEALIAKPLSRIIELSLSPEADIFSEAAIAIAEADLLVFGPGDLYTSILANCVVNGFKETVALSRARMVYVCNLMSKRGQTVGMHAKEHIAEIEKHIGRNLDVTLINSTQFDKDLLIKYEAEGDHPILNNCEMGVCVIRYKDLVSKDVLKPQDGDLVKRSLIRHDSAILAKELISILE